MNITTRAQAFTDEYAAYPAAWPHIVQEKGEDVLYATWVLGNDYRNRTALYGAYPPGYLARVMALFPEIPDRDVLHVFSGAVPPGEYLRLDSDPAMRPDVCGPVQDAPRLLGGRCFRLVVADPPYSAQDAAQYGTPMISRSRVLRVLSEVVRPGGYLAWLDTTWPMHLRSTWRTIGRITVIRSTNHRVRLLSLFERAR